MSELFEYAKDHDPEIPEAVDVASIRKKLNLSQVRFAEIFGLNLRTLQGWEIGHRIPDRGMKILLHLIGSHTVEVLDMLYPEVETE